jgi:hypothetical protein
MRTCGGCGKAQCRKYGPPERHGHFLDQIVVCPRCGWSGVESQILADDDDTPVQLNFFNMLNAKAGKENE